MHMSPAANTLRPVLKCDSVLPAAVMPVDDPGYHGQRGCPISGTVAKHASCGLT